MCMLQSALALAEEEKAEAMRARRQEAEAVYMQRHSAAQTPIGPEQLGL